MSLRDRRLPQAGSPDDSSALSFPKFGNTLLLSSDPGNHPGAKLAHTCLRGDAEAGAPGIGFNGEGVSGLCGDFELRGDETVLLPGEAWCGELLNGREANPGDLFGMPGDPVLHRAPGGEPRVEVDRALEVSPGGVTVEVDEAVTELLLVKDLSN